ncbi:hypothetical protein CC86DRAFT_375811 [Ophiobolus disseminans]|uniref:Uncharacterized protein n=1 Tax=Ophiobolus disseminans TaxID=1469910 RepID=A0A6A6ZBT2_9PLEO|nr:hypothetical protein CC86DRAFT_375811 [Ophiobolus disseminans]
MLHPQIRHIPGQDPAQAQDSWGVRGVASGHRANPQHNPVFTYRCNFRGREAPRANRRLELLLGSGSFSTLRDQNARLLASSSCHHAVPAPPCKCRLGWACEQTLWCRAKIRTV